MNLGLDIGTAGEIRAQRRMQYGPLFRAVDGIAAKHGRDARRQVRRARQVE
jgi:hypothetical protein